MSTSSQVALYARQVSWSAIALLSTPALAFIDNFEDGNTEGWFYATTGGLSSYGVALHNSSQMAYVSHTGSGSPFGSNTTSSSLSRDFQYLPAEMLSFDMHAVANTASGNPSGTKHSGSGVKVTLVNAFNIALGSFGLYNYTNPGLLGPNEYLIDNTQHNYSATMSSFAVQAGLDPLSPIAKINLTFSTWAQFSGGGNIYPNVGASASVWFDNVAVGPIPEPATYALLLSGLLVTVLAATRKK